MDNNQEQMPAHERWSYGLAHAVLIYLVALLLTLPAFMIIYPLVPELIIPVHDGIKVDHMITFVGLVGIFIIVVRKLQFWVYGIMLLIMCVITLTSLTGRYGFIDLYQDYALFVRDLYDHGNGTQMGKGRLADFQDSERLELAMDYLDSEVRNFAVMSATKNFLGVATNEQEQSLIQALSVFKEINSKWKYVADPLSEEYIARASESVALLAGDCDDHAVLMASAIRAIGGRVRLIRTKAHIYPELYVGNTEQMARAEYLIRAVLFKKEIGNEPVFHHIDDDGANWLNLDYTRKYPGGEIMDESIVGILQ